MSAAHHETWTSPEIEMVPAEVAADRRLVGELTDVVGRAVTAVCMTPPDVAGMIAAGQIALARVDGRVVGSIRIREVDDGHGELGLLVADRGHRRRGVGRALVAWAEHEALRRDWHVIQVEVPVPLGVSCATRDFLHAWLTRIGYRLARTVRVDEDHPAAAGRMNTPCDFVLYQKRVKSVRGVGAPTRRR